MVETCLSGSSVLMNSLMPDAVRKTPLWNPLAPESRRDSQYSWKAQTLLMSSQYSKRASLECHPPLLHFLTREIQSRHRSLDLTLQAAASLLEWTRMPQGGCAHLRLGTPHLAAASLPGSILFCQTLTAEHPELRLPPHLPDCPEPQCALPHGEGCSSNFLLPREAGWSLGAARLSPVHRVCCSPGRALGPAFFTLTTGLAPCAGNAIIRLTCFFRSLPPFLSSIICFKRQQIRTF